MHSLAYCRKGEAFIKLNKFVEAVDCFEKAIEINPNDKYSWYGKAFALINSGQIEEALKSLIKSIDIEQNYSTAQVTLASIYYKQGKKTEYEMHCGLARKIIEKNNAFDYNRACFEAICGDKVISFQIIERLLKDKKASLDWICADPDLETLRDDPRFQELLKIYSKKE